jgi:hypothetical protein
VCGPGIDHVLQNEHAPSNKGSNTRGGDNNYYGRGKSGRAGGVMLMGVAVLAAAVVGKRANKATRSSRTMMEALGNSSEGPDSQRAWWRQARAMAGGLATAEIQLKQFWQHCH